MYKQRISKIKRKSEIQVLLKSNKKCYIVVYIEKNRETT